MFIARLVKWAYFSAKQEALLTGAQLLNFRCWKLHIGLIGLEVHSASLYQIILWRAIPGLEVLARKP